MLHDDALEMWELDSHEFSVGDWMELIENEKAYHTHDLRSLMQKFDQIGSVVLSVNLGGYLLV